jgi:anti-sigma factor RsiW
MACKAQRERIDVYLDNELDLAASLELQNHLRECESCAQLQRKKQALRSAIRSSDLAFRAPPGLERRIRGAIGKAGGTGASRDKSNRMVFMWLAAAASLAIVFSLVWQNVGGRPGGEELLAQQVLTSHVRSLMANHLTDVVSSDTHTVKPWFAGKLDFSPPVNDLAAQQFPLVGGRLEYLERPIAALVYRRNQHVINVLIWPATASGDVPLEASPSRQGFNLLHWTRSGMTYWAISDLNQAELRQFVQLLQQ